MGIFGKRKSEAQNEDLVCSPKKQMRTGKETIPKSKVNVGENVTSSSEESDSDVSNEFLSKCIEDSEEDVSDGSSDSEDDVESSDDDDEEEEEQGDDDVGLKSSDNTRKIRVDNKVNTHSESAKVKLTKGNKNALGNTKDKGNISDTSEESSDSSSSEDSVDAQEVKNNSTDNTASKLKVASVIQKQQLDKKRKTVIQSSDDSSSDDSSVDDNIKLAEDKSVVKTNSGIGKSSKKENVSSSDTDSDDSGESDNESDDISTSGGNPISNVTQIHSKHHLDTKVKQDIKGKTKESVQESDSSDSDDDDDDDSDDASMKDEDDKEAENDESEDELAAVKKELADMPLEDLMKIKEKLGLKMFNRIMHGDKFEEKKQKVFKRENKNRPMEISAKKRVPVLRNAMVPKEKVRRDPRFDDLSGEFQDKHFMKNYAFLDDVKQKEKLLVQKKLKKTKDEEKKKELAKLLNRMNQQEQLEQKKRQRMEMEQQWKEKEKQLVKEGKTPYFLKKSDKKKLELAEKYKELQKSGKVDHYMSKKMKKNAQKEKKKLPGRHQRFM